MHVSLQPESTGREARADRRTPRRTRSAPDLRRTRWTGTCAGSPSMPGRSAAWNIDAIFRHTIACIGERRAALVTCRGSPRRHNAVDAGHERGLSAAPASSAGASVATRSPSHRAAWRISIASLRSMSTICGVIARLAILVRNATPPAAAARRAFSGRDLLDHVVRHGDAAIGPALPHAVITPGDDATPRKPSKQMAVCAGPPRRP